MAIRGGAVSCGLVKLLIVALAVLASMGVAAARANAEPTFLFSIGGRGSEPGEFEAPGGLALDQSGHLWVADAWNNRIEEYSETGGYIGSIGLTGSEAERLASPWGVAVDGSGDVWVADSENNRIAEFAPNGEFIQAFGEAGSGAGQFLFPVGIAIDGSGHLWVSDLENGRLEEFDQSGTFIRQIGNSGSESERLEYPEQLAIDGKGNIWVADWGKNRVSVFDDEGEVIRQVGSEGSGEGELSHPEGLAILPSGQVVVGDAGNNRVELFSDMGSFVGEFHSAHPTESVEFPFEFGNGIAAGSDEDIWVADQGNAQVQRWSLNTPPIPVCHDTSLEVLHGEPLTVEASEDCVGEGSLEFEIVEAPEHGSVSGFNKEAGTLLYTPSPGYSGSDQLKFRASNVNGQSSAATIHISVEAGPLSGMVAAYSFDAGEGEIAEDLKGEYDGSLRGAEWTAGGKYGGALQFDGASEVLVPEPPDLRESSGFTVEAWVRPHSMPWGWTSPVIAQEGSNSNRPSYILEAAPGEGAYAHLFSEGGEWTLSGSEPLPKNQWSHVALASNGEEAQLYVDGKLVDSSFAPPLESPKGPLRIGNESFDQGFDGLIDEVRIYAEALTAEEIRADAETPVQAEIPPSGPLAEYPLDEGEGTRAHDIIGESDGVLEGPGWISGRNGAALQFDGEAEDSVALTGGPTLDWTKPFTLEAWVRGSGESAWQPVIASNSGEATIGNGLYATGSGSLPVGVLATGSGNLEVVGTEALPEGWTFESLTSDGEELRLYLDGTLVDSATESDVSDGTGSLRVGAVPSMNRALDGDVDEVRVYSRALSVTEILQDREAIVAGPELDVSGPIFEAPAESIVSPESPIIVDAYDGSEITSIDLLLGGEVERHISSEQAFEHGARQTCSGDRCHFHLSLRADAGDSSLTGEEAIGIRVEDAAGRRATRTHNSVFDAAAPEIYFDKSVTPLENGNTTELEIRARDTFAAHESGIAEIRVEVDGEIVMDEHFECSPSCPESASAPYLFNASEWSEGPHRISISAFDGAGNQSEEFILVGATPEILAPTCSGAKPTEVGVANPVTSAEAETFAEANLAGAFEDGPEHQAEIFGEQFWRDGTEIGAGGGVWVAPRGFTDAVAQKAPGGSFTIGSSACFKPTLITSDEKPASRLYSSWLGIVYANSAPDTDTVLRPTPLGLAIIESVRGSSAPSSFSWEVPLGEAEEFVELSSGGLAIVKTDGIDITPTDVPSVPPTADHPAGLSSSEVQTEASLAEIAAANDESSGQVMGVISPPVYIDELGELHPAALSASGESVTVSKPEGARAVLMRASSTPSPAALCAEEHAPLAAAEYVAACGPEEQGDRGSVSALSGGDGSLTYSFEATGPSETAEPAISRLFKMSEAGTEVTQLTKGSFQYLDPQMSSDEEMIVATRCDRDGSHCGIHLLKSDGSNDQLLVESVATGREFHPVFSPNGDEVYFYKAIPTGGGGESREWQLYAISSSGTEERQITAVATPSGCTDGPPCNLGLGSPSGAPAVDPDGETLAVAADGQLWQLASGGVELGWEELEAMTEFGTGSQVSFPAFRPDGSQIAFYFATEEGAGAADGIYVVSASGGTPSKLVGYAEDPRGATSLTYVGKAEELAYAREGSVYTTASSGGTPILLSTGDESVSLAEALPSDATSAAETAEAWHEEAKELISSSEGAFDASEEELVWCLATIVHVKECELFAEDRSQALAMRGRIFTNRELVDRSTRGNAFQHAYWTALMVGDSIGQDGLAFALLHERTPLSWDAQQDILNDYMGNRWRFGVGGEPDDIEACEALRVKTKRDLFIGDEESPFRWANQEQYRYYRMVFRWLHSNLGHGPVVKLNGRRCELDSPT